MADSNLDASVNNSPYDDEALQHFKQLLMEQKEETQEQLNQLKASVDDIQSNQGENSSAAAHHEGDIASEEDEREKYLLMINKEKEKMNQINAALDRIELGTYGVCQETGQKIRKERLEAIPYTRVSIQKGE